MSSVPPGRAAFLTAAALLLACDGTSPVPRLDGVWGGRVSLFAAADSLRLAIGEHEGQIRGFAILQSLDGPPFRTDMYYISGSGAGRSVELHLRGAFGFGSLVFRGELSGRRLSGTVTGAGEEKSITVRLSNPASEGVAGTWGLASTSGPPFAIRDTIVVLPDGRGRRHREHESSSYGTLTMWSRRGAWLILEQLGGVGFGIPFLDSLRIEPNALVRSTRLFDGSTVTETYARTP